MPDSSNGAGLDRKFLAQFAQQCLGFGFALFDPPARKANGAGCADQATAANHEESIVLRDDGHDTGSFALVVWCEVHTMSNVRVLPIGGTTMDREATSGRRSPSTLKERPSVTTPREIGKKGYEFARWRRAFQVVAVRGLMRVSSGLPDVLP